MKALLFLASVAIVGLVLTGAIKLQKSNNTISIHIDRKQVAEEASKVLEEGKELLEDVEAAWHDDE